MSKQEEPIFTNESLIKPNYTELEALMPKYSDLAKVEVQENGERFVSLDPQRVSVGYLPVFSDMRDLLGDSIPVREQVAKKIYLAQLQLQTTSPDLSLKITYGFRDLTVQTQRFIKAVQEQTSFFPNPVDLYEEAHRYIAVPTVAGHPTGGAIDVTIINNDTHEPINFGSPQYDFSTKDSYVFANTVTGEAKRNRQLLRDTMMGVGFAPFDGEWWHFSYGDREWAYYHKKPNAIYNQIDLTNMKNKIL